MNDKEQLDYIMTVLRATSKHDIRDGLHWNCDGSKPVTFYMNCSDQFWWACSDAERITPRTSESSIEQARISSQPPG